jgi:broad specificity phosphatase PhoE
MGTLTLVRHGQASFGAADYDQLSEQGRRQCLRLGEYLRERGLRFAAVWRGSLTRHAQSLAALEQGHGGLPAATVDAALDEYHSHALLPPQPAAAALPPPTTPDGYRQHFRLLRQALTDWMAGRSAPAGMPAYAEFRAGLRRVSADMHRHCRGQDRVLVVSSGGPISCLLTEVLAAPAATAIELNMRLRNSALSELVSTAHGFALQSFNHLPHLDGAGFADWVSHT